MNARRIAVRGELLDYLGDPRIEGDRAVRHVPDGVLVVADGRVERIGPAADILPALGPDVAVTDHRGRLVLPGFVDLHVHFPQVEVIASYGAQLLDWLERYTFPAESRYAAAPHAAARAEWFVRELLRNGTTTAAAFATVHPTSVDALFGAADRRGMRLITGRVMMDRHCPDALRDDTERSYEESLALADRWHGRARLGYAVTPRFAATSSERQLSLAGRLMRERPGLHLQSHVAENVQEIAWVRELFPDRRSYLDVYDHHGLLGARSVYAHCIHLDARDLERMAESGAAIAFCPTSNLFLGSGLFDLAAADRAGIRVGLATDVGGGTSLGMLRTMSEAYKVLQLRNQSLPAHRAYYLATLGGARALDLDASIGNFETGKEADFVVLDWAPTPIMAMRLEHARDLEERLFVLMMLGDERNVHATHLLGGQQDLGDVPPTVGTA
jgi:guanine deaminase